jgi:hypothetical protein
MNSTVNQVAGCIPSLTHLMHHTTVSKTLNILTGTIVKPITPTQPSCEPLINMTCAYIATAMQQATADAKVSIRDALSACPNLHGANLNHCLNAYNSVYNAEVK